MPWRRFPSIAAAARAFKDSGIKSGGMIASLLNGSKPQHNGFEARRCDDDDRASARAHPSAPVAAVGTNPVASRGGRAVGRSHQADAGIGEAAVGVGGATALHGAAGGRDRARRPPPSPSLSRPAARRRVAINETAEMGTERSRRRPRMNGRATSDREDGGAASGGDEAGSHAHPSPPFFAAMTTKPVEPAHRANAAASASSSANRTAVEVRSVEPRAREGGSQRSHRASSLSEIALRRLCARCDASTRRPASS